MSYFNDYPKGLNGPAGPLGTSTISKVYEKSYDQYEQLKAENDFLRDTIDNKILSLYNQSVKLEELSLKILEELREKT